MEKEVNQTSGTYILENIGVLPSANHQTNLREVIGMEPVEMAFWLVNTGLLLLITMKEFALL